MKRCDVWQVRGFRARFLGPRRHGRSPSRFRRGRSPCCVLDPVDLPLRHSSAGVSIRAHGALRQSVRGSHTRVPILRKSAPFPRVKPPDNPGSSRGRADSEPRSNLRRGARAGLRFPLVRGPLCRRGGQNVLETIGIGLILEFALLSAERAPSSGRATRSRNTTISTVWETWIFVVFKMGQKRHENKWFLKMRSESLRPRGRAPSDALAKHYVFH